MIRQIWCLLAFSLAPIALINAAKQQTGFFLATAGDGHKGPIDPVFILSIAAAQFN